MKTTQIQLGNISAGHREKIDQLAEAYLYQVAHVIAFPQVKSVKFLLSMVIGKAAKRLAELSVELDLKIKQGGPAIGAKWLLSHFVAGYEAQGVEAIPAEGPLIIAANHPSSYDALVISAYINRMDYKIIIGEIPPYHYLPNVSKHAIFAPPVKDIFGRMGTIREAIQHLGQGGALLIFPRGNIEPDPAFMPDPGFEFDQWSRSLEIILQRIPQTRVLITIVSGVVSQTAIQHPITWFRRSQQDRQRLAYIYQIIRQVLSGDEQFGLRSQVTFGEILSDINGHNLLAEVERAARNTLQQHISHFKLAVR
jgi:1-acyl-sn-glycerol-3-phosphate acyltransferase